MKASHDRCLQLFRRTERGAEVSSGPALNFVEQIPLAWLRLDGLIDEHEDGHALTCLQVLLVGRGKLRVLGHSVPVSEDEQCNIRIPHAGETRLLGTTGGRRKVLGSDHLVPEHADGLVRGISVRLEAADQGADEDLHHSSEPDSSDNEVVHAQATSRPSD